MNKLKIISKALFVIFSCFALNACSTNKNIIAHNYDTFNYSIKSSVLKERIFYLLNALAQSPVISQETNHIEAFYQFNKKQNGKIIAADNNCNDIICLANALEIDSLEMKESCEAFGKLYRQSAFVQRFVKNKIRPSGYYALSNQFSDSLLFIQAWKEQVDGMNYIFDAYLKNKGLHYPQADSASYNTKSPAYYDSIKFLLHRILVETKKSSLPCQTNVAMALAILQLNKRNEAGRFIPLSSVNKNAYKRERRIKWQQYKYSAILVFGAGPGKRDIAFSPINKVRCDSAVALYQKGIAPFLIVSGGFVHPFQTKYCEAMEMKKYMMRQYHIPSNAILLEPHARHTTTNIRNANRILIENHFPLDKPVLGVSSEGHIDYIVGDQFLKVFHRDMGYVPFTHMQRVSVCEASYMPAIASLQINSLEPLDP